VNPGFVFFFFLKVGINEKCADFQVAVAMVERMHMHHWLLKDHQMKWKQMQKRR
jgi:hypothetical protein